MSENEPKEKEYPKKTKLKILVVDNGCLVLIRPKPWIELVLASLLLIVFGQVLWLKGIDRLLSQELLLVFGLLYAIYIVLKRLAVYELKISKEEFAITQNFFGVRKILHQGETASLTSVVFAQRQFETRKTQALFSKRQFGPVVKGIRFMQALKAFDAPFNITQDEAKWIEAELTKTIGVSVNWE